MIIPLSNDTLYFDWNLTTIDNKEVPFEVVITDIDEKQEILTSGEELDAFCRIWNANNPLKAFPIFTEIAMRENDNPIERVATIRSILKTFWYIQPAEKIKKMGTYKLS